MFISKVIKPCIFLLLIAFAFSSCTTRRLGYGVLLWSSEDPPVPSGTVLPVYIRSNINQVWVAGIPREFRPVGSRMDKFEIPLPKLELTRNRRRAEEIAQRFAPYALLYAETLQDGLPIRERPDNTTRRVYRLRLGQVIKILGPANGVIPVGTTGEPLPGAWYRVLTQDGTIGYCFSYRLRLFEHAEGSLASLVLEEHTPVDPALERLLSRTWSPESYRVMINNRRINLEEFNRHWHFDPGHETGTARIFTREMDRSFPFTHIRATGTQSWRFEGSSLQMNLRNENTLAVQFPDEGGLLRTLVFVALPSRVEDIILQETARRDELFRTIYEHGPVFTSANYGVLTFEPNRRFTWTGNHLLVPGIIPATALASGTLDMRLFVGGPVSELYMGAFTMSFDGFAGNRAQADFMFTLDSQGLRIEHVPHTSLDGQTVVRRASSPLVIFFFRDERSETRLPFTESWDFFQDHMSFDLFDYEPFEFEFDLSPFGTFEDSIFEILPDTGF